MLTLVVQAGGESRRMGRDKGLVPFLGRPLIQRVIERLAPSADQVIVTTNQPDAYRFLGVPLVPDILPGRGALGGLYTALEAANHPLVAVVACDMPFASPALLSAQRTLVEQPGSPPLDAAIPLLPGGTEPFHSVYRRSACLPLIQAALEADKWRVDAWFSKANIHFIKEDEVRRYDPDLRCFLNVNTPEDLTAAEALAARE